MHLLPNSHPLFFHHCYSSRWKNNQQQWNLLTEIRWCPGPTGTRSLAFYYKNLCLHLLERELKFTYFLLFYLNFSKWNPLTEIRLHHDPTPTRSLVSYYKNLYLQLLEGVLKVIYFLLFYHNFSFPVIQIVIQASHFHHTLIFHFIKPHGSYLPSLSM